MRFRMPIPIAIPMPILTYLTTTHFDHGAIKVLAPELNQTFFVGDAYIDRMGGEKRKSMSGVPATGSALAIVLKLLRETETLAAGAGRTTRKPTW